MTVISCQALRERFLAQLKSFSDYQEQIVVTLRTGVVVMPISLIRQIANESDDIEKQALAMALLTLIEDEQ